MTATTIVMTIVMTTAMMIATTADLR
jgi:hypothetical protein